jgi:septum formation protein
VGKALAVARQHAGEHAVVLAADTIVAVGPDDSFELLGKPVDAEDERRMLRLLSNSRHQVVTGVCAVDCRGVPVGVGPGGAGPGLRTGVETTYVTMRALSVEDIEAYVATDEWRDKAGGYAIQDGADRFVTCLEGGGRDNVVGLPVALALRLISEGLAPTPSAP